MWITERQGAAPQGGSGTENPTMDALKRGLKTALPVTLLRSAAKLPNLAPRTQYLQSAVEDGRIAHVLLSPIGKRSAEGEGVALAGRFPEGILHRAGEAVQTRRTRFGPAAGRDRSGRVAAIFPKSPEKIRIIREVCRR